MHAPEAVWLLLGQLCLGLEAKKGVYMMSSEEIQTLPAAQSQCEGERSCSDVLRQCQLLSIAVTASHTQDRSRQRLSSGFKKEASKEKKQKGFGGE